MYKTYKSVVIKIYVVTMKSKLIIRHCRYLLKKFQDIPENCMRVNIYIFGHDYSYILMSNAGTDLQKKNINYSSELDNLQKKKKEKEGSLDLGLKCFYIYENAKTIICIYV